MPNTILGNVGHLLVIITFITSIVTAISYFLAQRTEKVDIQKSWKYFARGSFLIHGLSVLTVFILLFYIIYSHKYEYHYAYEHSSNNLPIQYMISCFWEGQEGSFLLWIIWNAMIGGILIFTNKSWESPVMTIFALVQAFLTSMVMGVVFFEGMKVGSSPFLMTSDVLQIPVYNPSSPVFDANFIPTDGTGLNPLLQNIWMVIHPPTLFLGFALTLVPFAFAIAGLWKNKFTEWIEPNLPWSLLSAAILGLGIMMGAYWAYETLNFGGYWNWDPVENAVYVPWLILVAAIHSMMVAKRNPTALKVSFILSILTFLLILYSTFLTRSGILGSASVHSFTDLGLSGQLLIYLLTFVAIAIVLLIVKWKKLPTSEKEIEIYSQEFWVLIGAMVLCLAGFQVINTTSFPVYSKIAQLFSKDANFALPADQVAHYTKFQVWFAIIIAMLSGIGQYFWWSKMDSGKKLFDKITTPLIFTMIGSALIIIFTKESNFVFMTVILAALFSIFTNGHTLLSLIRKKPQLSGGAIAHIGIALMLIGILYSAGYSKVVSLNTSTMVYTTEKDAPKDFNKENVLLWLDDPMMMNGYQITYKGMYIEASGFPGHIRQQDVVYTQDLYRVIALKDIFHEGKKYFDKGDTLRTQPENIYYKVQYRDEKGKLFHLFPRLQVNSQMGMTVSPDIKFGFSKDLYTHVTMIYPDPNEGRKYSDPQEYKVAVKDTFVVNDYIAIFEGVQRFENSPLMSLQKGEVGIQANIRILDKDKEHLIKPSFLIRKTESDIARPEVTVPELGLRLSISNIDPENQLFSFSVKEGQKDFIIMKAVEKPMINILWIGSLIVMLGMMIAMFRRFKPSKTSSKNL